MKQLTVMQDQKGYVKCPFCGHKHKHGFVDGHRIPHCDGRPTSDFVDAEGNLHQQILGYYVVAPMNKQKGFKP